MKFLAMHRQRPARLAGSVSVVGLVLAGAATPVFAQYTEPPKEAGGAMGVQQAANNDAAAGEVPKRAWTIVPSITVGETITDNVAPGMGDKRGDQITEISPGINITGNSARAKLHFDYRIRKYLYAQESGQRRAQNSLNAFGTFVAVENWMFIDVSGAIAQQDISPFGVQTPSTASINANRTETSNFRVSPYFRGRLAGYADYELRYSRSATQTESTTASDVDTGEWSGKIGGATPLASVSWSVDTNRQTVDYSSGRRSEADHTRGMLSYTFSPQFKISLSAGQESNDYASLTKETRNTHGYGFDWAPTERTQVSAFRENRFFGEGHTFNFSHRTPLSAWKYTDSRNVSVLPNQLGTVGLGSIYDLMFSQLESSVPDPIERAALVNSQLQILGIPPNARVTSGFLSSRVSLQRRQELSFLLQGVRNVLTVAATRSENQRLGSTTGVDDAFLNSGTIRQRGFNVNLSHRLSPLSSLAVSASQQKSTGSGANAIETKQRSLTANFTTKLGPKTTASLGARRTIFESTTQPYSESALTGTLTAQF